MPSKFTPKWVAAALQSVDQAAACGFYNAPQLPVSRYEIAAFVMTCRGQLSRDKALPTADNQKLFRDLTQEYADEMNVLETRDRS